MKFWGLDESANLGAAFFSIADAFPNSVVYSQAQYDGQLESREHRKWIATNFADVKSRVCKIARYLESLNIKPGSRVAILSTSRPEWMEADLAIISLGAVSVSIYQTLPEPEVAYILFDSGADVVFVENEEQANKIAKINGNTWDIQGTEDRPAAQEKIEIKKIISFEDCPEDPMTVNLRTIINSSEAGVPRTVATIKRNDLASFVYTSGTTGPPKGVMQTHGNHLSNVRQAAQSGLFKDSSTIMLFLPLAHSFAKLMGYVGFLTPASLKFIAVIDTHTSRMEPVSVTRDIREGSANIVPIVPRLLEKMKEGILRQSHAPGAKGLLLRNMLSSSLEVYDKGSAAPVSAKILNFLLGPLKRKIKMKLFGEHFNYCISGGAKLPVHVGKFFDALGVEILEGYGLTETCVATNVNRLGNKKVGTVGPLLSPDIELKIEDDGEICFRGPNISLGYYNRKTATHASWSSDGWFKTGDLGAVDKDGFLAITGRKKEIIVSSNGKKIAPNDIEDHLKNFPYVSQVMLCGEGKPYCSAIFTLNEDSVKRWFEGSRYSLAADSKYSQDERVRDLIWSHVEQVNSKLANFEQIRKITIVSGDFTVENGLLTPTFKVKRKTVENRFKDLIEQMY
jgi:long-chain acyl-CoA synthetase